MGRDKALLPLADGRLLWQRQLGVLEGLGARELFFSGPPRPGFPADLRLLPDPQPGLGPIAGLCAALEAMSTPRLLALAIDLPAMTAAYLASLLALDRAVVPAVEGRLEPLAAVYPGEGLALACERLAAPDRSLRSFVAAAEALGLLEIVEVTRDQERLFVNWNRPADLAPQSFQRPV